MKIVFFQILFTILLCNWNVSTGQYFEHIDIYEGLNSARINDIEKDSLGFMWFASANGVDRYSGSDFKHYDLSLLTSIPYDNNVLSIKIIDGNIWVTLRNGHLLKYDYSLDRFKILAFKQARHIRAKVAMWEEDWTEAAAQADAIIESGHHSLVATEEVFKGDLNHSETLFVTLSGKLYEILLDHMNNDNMNESYPEGNPKDILQEYMQNWPIPQNDGYN